MLVLTVVAPVFGTNCTIVAAGPGAPCVVVDAGAGASERGRALIEVHALQPRAVVPTHGPEATRATSATRAACARPTRCPSWCTARTRTASPSRSAVLGAWPERCAGP